MSHAHGNGHGPDFTPEASDANIPLVVKTTIGILVMVVACMVIAAFQFKFELAEMPPEEETIFSNKDKLPPQPRLQASPAKDLASFKEQQAHRLESFSWADKENEIAAIPVDKAMDMVLKQGLPVRDPNRPPLLAPEKPAPKTGAAKQ
ncbi:MAG: hypothetical protein HYZ37_19195 [Candidatus Solibacter usitatus]|nr:hypothetical protein [Candidatus Solibacter usitatus]